MAFPYPLLSKHPHARGLPFILPDLLSRPFHLPPALGGWSLQMHLYSPWFSVGGLANGTPG